MWESDGPLSVWRTDVVTWLYANAHSPDAHKPLPQRYADICHTYAVWKLCPVEHALPLTCTRSDPLPWHAAGYHTEWQTLILEVFGVSATEFEAGWQAFLAEHYP